MLKPQSFWQITILGDRLDTDDVIRTERFFGNEDAAAQRACIIMGKHPRADLTPA